MPFTFKLSQRLARIRRPAFVSQATALAILLVFACEIPSRPHLPGDVPTYRLVVSPRALTLQQNQSADLVAAVLSTEGLTANLAVSWNASSGAITDTITNNGNHYGRYRAGQDTGKVKVIVKGDPGGLADTTIVTVTPAPVWAVPVSPATATVQAGRTAQLFGTPTDANGNPLPLAVPAQPGAPPPLVRPDGTGDPSQQDLDQAFPPAPPAPQPRQPDPRSPPPESTEPRPNTP